jgi:dihydroflavonol-4-reductase
VAGPRTVFVSGGTGFIASHTVRQLLEGGARVRASVRRAKAPSEQAFLREMPGGSERLELVEADLTVAGAFEPHLAGCEVVLHIASPYVLDSEDPQRDLVQPAVLGTRSMLEACARASCVRRVVLTSSMAAITDEPPPRVLTEEDWNDRSSLTRNPYYLSKTLAEREAWAFVQSRRPAFDLVVLNPFLVVGPSLTPSVNPSNRVLVDLLNGTFPGILGLTWGFVDVRDVALAHLRAMDAGGAAGRYICAAGTRSMREVVSLLRANGFAGRLPRLPLDNAVGNAVVKIASWAQPKGVGQYLRSHVGRVPRFDNSKIRRDLGLDFRPVERTILDTAADLVRWGHVAPPSGE